MFVFIILDVILPILILMLIGAILQRKFQFNLKAAIYTYYLLLNASGCICEYI